MQPKTRKEEKLLVLEGVLKSAAELAAELGVSTEHINAFFSRYRDLCLPSQPQYAAVSGFATTRFGKAPAGFAPVFGDAKEPADVCWIG